MLRIFNSLTGDKEVFKPIVPGKIGMYVCGVTPYDFSHLGHARTYVTFDCVTRYLRESGFDVTVVRNYTDVDDKIIKKANEANEPAGAVSERFIAFYDEDMKALGVLPPTHAPKVTQTIPEIVALVQRLVDRGVAYAVEGDVYFEVSKFPEYLKLSKRSLDENQAGARVDVDQRKRSPADFALWKAAKPGEPQWPSPFGPGRPGWHIECSAMAFRHLGETFDIHGGGRDLMFPHHDNEIAQSEAASHVQFSNWWMHAGMLNIDNEKMSKSLGNFFTIRDVLKRTDAEALRAFFLQAQYRGPMSFEFSLIEEADKRLAYVYKTLHRIDTLLAGAEVSEGAVFKPELTEGIWERFAIAMDDDFNTASAMSSLSPLLGFLNELLDKPQKPRDQMLRTLKMASAGLRRCGKVLGLYEQAPGEYLARRKERLVQQRNIDVAMVEKLIEERKIARQEKRFADSDALRGQLLNHGVVVQDGPGGSAVWEVIDN